VFEGVSNAVLCFVTAINALCAPLQCDQRCEVAAVSNAVSFVQAYCTCEVSFMRVRVQPNLRCSSK